MNILASSFLNFTSLAVAIAPNRLTSLAKDCTSALIPERTSCEAIPLSELNTFGSLRFLPKKEYVYPLVSINSLRSFSHFFSLLNLVKYALISSCACSNGYSIPAAFETVSATFFAPEPYKHLISHYYEDWTIPLSNTLVVLIFSSTSLLYSKYFLSRYTVLSLYIQDSKILASLVLYFI